MRADEGLHVRGVATAGLGQRASGLACDASKRPTPAGVRHGEAAGSHEHDGRAVGKEQHDRLVGNRAHHSVGPRLKASRTFARTRDERDLVAVHLVRHDERVDQFGRSKRLHDASAVFRDAGRVVATLRTQVEAGERWARHAARTFRETKRDPARHCVAGTEKGHAVVYETLDVNAFVGCQAKCRLFS